MLPKMASEMSLVTVVSVIFHMKNYFLSFRFIWLLACFLDIGYYYIAQTGFRHVIVLLPESLKLEL